MNDPLGARSILSLRAPALVALVTFIALVGACSDSSTPSGAPEVPTSLAACSPGCAAGSFCLHESNASPICPGDVDAGVCPAGCPGCPSPTATKTCRALPEACAAATSCACLLEALCGGCGVAAGECGTANGEWQVACMRC